MAEEKRRGYGEDGSYFDHQGDCRDSAHHKTCSGRWRGVVSPGCAADGKRIRLRDVEPACQVAIERDAVLRPAGSDRFQAGRSPERAADREMEQDPNGSKPGRPHGVTLNLRNELTRHMLTRARQEPRGSAAMPIVPCPVWTSSGAVT